LPKEVLKIDDFGRGLNNNSDPASLENDELYEAQNLELSEKGTIKMPGRATGQVKAATTLSAGIGQNGSIAGWASDHSRQTDLVIIDPGEGNILDFVGKWAFTNVNPNAALGMGRVVLIKENINYNASPMDWLYVTNEYTTIAQIASAWAATDDIFYADDAIGTNMTQYGAAGCVGAVEPGPGVPESNQWLAHLATDGDVSLYNYNSDRYFSDVFDLGSGTSISGSAGVQDQVLRISDITFESEYALTNKSQWFGYIRRDMFQYDTTAVGRTSESRWINADADLLSFSDIGCSIVLHDSSSANVNSATVGGTAGHIIVVSYWKEKDESGLNAYVGGWSGTYQFAVCPIYDEKQYGEIDELGSIDFAEHTLNISVSVAAGTTQPTGFLSIINKWPGVGTTNNKRVTGIRIYFKSISTEDWYILKDVDFVHGDVGTKWQTIEPNTETTFGMAAMTSFALALDQATNSADEEYAVTTANCTVTYTLTSTSGWANRSGFIRVHGFHYDPVYVSIPVISAASGSAKDIPVTNPVAGTYQTFAELIDENYQFVGISAPNSLTFIAGSQGAPPTHAGYGCYGYCWVAAEIWGQNDVKTRQARFYVITNNNWFVRLYLKYGITWSNMIRGRKWLQSIIKPIWIYMCAQGKEYFDKPTGHYRITQAIRDLKKKYPGQFKYYLIGSNARNERVTHFYDINIVPQQSSRYRRLKVDTAMWKDVLKTLYYVQEEDKRYANPSICPQFYDAKDYSGEEVYKHRDDEVDCYFYYDKKFPKYFLLENLGEVDNIDGNLWHNIIPLIGDKWRTRGLDRIPYHHKEIK